MMAAELTDGRLRVEEAQPVTDSDGHAIALGSFSAPFVIKPEKTRYGSSAGSNWNLGVMLNRDNQITIGHRNKKRFRSMVCSYLLDRQNGKPWPLRDVQTLSGLMSYYAMVEKPYVERVVQYNNQKYHTDLLAALKADQRPPA